MSEKILQKTPKASYTVYAAGLMASEAAEAEPSLRRQAHGNLVYLVENDNYMADFLASQLNKWGYEICVFGNLQGLSQAIKQHPPSALVMDVMLTVEKPAGVKALLSIQKDRDKPLPAIFISANNTNKARTAAISANGDAFFTKPFDIKALVEKLREL
ncbi:MAG: response regulator, partial [Gammaproteobacteria bacterium]|nr:response regulator [Gammaproteobacteria bacterium]